MYTYDPNANKKNVDSENMNSLNEEDLFLAGGFDSFSEPNDNLNVGTPYMSNVDQYAMSHQTINKMHHKSIPGKMEQFLTSFNPIDYHIYADMSIGDVKAFIKAFSRFYSIFVIIITMIFMGIGLNMQGISVSTMFSPLYLVVFVVVFAIVYFWVPIGFRIMAWIYRWVARLIALIFKKNLSDEHLYSVSFYPLIPFQLCSVIVELIAEFVGFSTIAMVLSVFSSLLYFLPAVYMLIAIPRMK